MSHKKLRPFIVKVSVLGVHFTLCRGYIDNTTICEIIIKVY